MANLDALKQKYQPAIDLAQSRGVAWKNIHIENEKLLIRGAAPNDKIKDEVWTKIKSVDHAFADLTVDLTIDASLKVPAIYYTVVSGDTLSKIATHYYGDSNAYMRIFEANKDQLKNPNMIQVGQKLLIPE